MSLALAMPVRAILQQASPFCKMVGEPTSEAYRPHVAIECIYRWLVASR